ncbi:DUF983 domain-containing protein [Phenylobacterium sp.]|uniref:DUF983 domain-containing protein n=1 Tax=Phenylobacterium sp. TaxID=1871053 RepID=UPI00345D67EC
MATEFAYPLFRSIGRGLAHRCPACGEGRLYRRYLKVEPNCGRCAHDLTVYRADDGPAYLTILLVGHLVVGPLLLFPVVWEASPLVVLPIVLGWLTLVTLTVLPRIKGAWVGLMYALQSTDRDQHLHTADAAD